MTTPSPLPTDEDAREEIARIVKRVSQKFGGPSMAEFADTPPLRKHYATADAILAAGFRRSVVSTPSEDVRALVREGREQAAMFSANRGELIHRLADALEASAVSAPPVITEAHIVDRFGSLSSASLRRIADAAECVIDGRAEDGVFS